MKIIKNEQVILQGKRNLDDGLWDVQLKDLPPPSAKLNAIINKNQSKSKLAAYYHACYYSPCVRTLRTAIRNGNFDSWPSLAEESLYKYMGRTMATSMGHLDQKQQGLQSTKATSFLNNHESSLNEKIANNFFRNQKNL